MRKKKNKKIKQISMDNLICSLASKSKKNTRQDKETELTIK